MSKKKRRKSKVIDRKSKVLFIKVATITVSLILVVLIGVMVTKPNSSNKESITMTKKYEPSDDVASSLKMNSDINNGTESNKTDSQVAEQQNNAVTANLDTENNLSSMEVDQSENNTVIDSSGNESNSTVTTETIDNQPVNNSKENNSKENNSSDEVNIDEVVVIPNGLTEEEEIQFVKDKWVDDMIHENQSEISQSDLSQGATIYNSLDTAYLFGLAKDGLTPEEKQDAMDYLESQLGPEQLEVAMTLFNKYIGLVN